MKNPHQKAKDLKPVRWLWETNKADLLGTTIGTLAVAALLLAIDPVDTWWGYGIIVPVWYSLHIVRWAFLYKKNLKAYHNWEETFGMLKKN